MVDGVAASSYSGNYLGSEPASHAAMGVFRLAYRIAPWAFRLLHSLRLAEPMFVSMGRATQKVRRHSHFISILYELSLAVD